MKVLNFILRIFCDKTGQPSSMRISMLVVTGFVCLNLLQVYSYIGLSMISHTVIDWLGLAAFITSLVALLAAVYTGKVQQTKQE